jgi:hypothetical protein
MVTSIEGSCASEKTEALFRGVAGVGVHTKLSEVRKPWMGNDWQMGYVTVLWTC